MNLVRKQRLVKLVLFLTGLVCITGLVLYALRQNISLFYTPTQIAKGEAPINYPIRMGGMVKKHSVLRKLKNLNVQFTLTDFNHEVVVFYNGILPDLFREGQGVVASGSIDKQGRFNAIKILAKHDENYMPPEIKGSINMPSKERVSV